MNPPLGQRHHHQAMHATTHYDNKLLRSSVGVYYHNLIHISPLLSPPCAAHMADAGAVNTQHLAVKPG